MTFSSLPLKLRLAGALPIALACIWITVDVRSCVGRRRDAARAQKADQLDASQATHGTQAVTHEQEAEGLKPVLQQDDAAVARSRAAVERLRPSHPGPDPAPGPGPHAPEPVSPPVELAALDAAKDQLISDLTKDLADTKTALQAALAGDQERQAQVKDLQAENGQLRAIIAARPTVRTWSVGAVYGTNQTVGGYISKDLGILQVGVQVVRRALNGGQSTLEAQGYAGMRF